MMHSHTNCICLTFSTVRFKCLFKLHCRKYALSNRLPKKMHSRIYCICLIFLHCVFSNAASNCLHYMKYDHTHVAWLHVETVSLQNGALWYSMCFLKTLSYKYLPRKKQLKCVVAWCTFKCALKLPTKWEIMKMMEHLKIHVQCKGMIQRYKRGGGNLPLANDIK